MSRIIHPPTGDKLSCKNWQIEAAYRMIQHNLDPDVAEVPDELIVYGGRGKAARNWECYDAILETLKRQVPNLSDQLDKLKRQERYRAMP